MNIYFSNRLKELGKLVIAKMLKQGALKKSVIVVSSDEMKRFLQQLMAEEFAIFFGIEIWTLSQALVELKHLGQKIPTQVELCLGIESILPTIEDEKLAHYLRGGKRTSSLSRQLAPLFAHYGVFGGRNLVKWEKQEGWQQTLWKRLFAKEWSYPYRELQKGKSAPFPIALFGFSHLPHLYLHFFSSMGADLYLFSPCATFWQEKELDHPLLMNLGGLGRRFLNEIEPFVQKTYDHYLLPKGESALATVQRDCLELNAPSPLKNDGSISFASAPTPLREVEVFYDYLLPLLTKTEPKEVAVFVPNIEVYAPYIHAVFGSGKSQIDYAISGLSALNTSLMAIAFFHLLDLPQKRFSLEAIFALFSFSPILNCFPYTHLEWMQLKEWLKEKRVFWGIDDEQREALLGGEKMVEEGARGTFEGGIQALFADFIALDVRGISWTELPILADFIAFLRSLKEDFQPMIEKKKLKISEWIERLFHIATTHLKGKDEEIEQVLTSLKKGTEHLQTPLPFPSIRESVEALLLRKKRGYQKGHQNSVQFAPLSPGCATPKKVVALLGLEEEAFPRKEVQSSLGTLEESDPFPTAAQEDRYRFLELFLSASENFYCSYPSLSKEEGKKLNPSPIFDELLSLFSEKLTVEYPLSPFVLAAKKNSPLFPEFYKKSALRPAATEEVVIQELGEFAKNPIRYACRRQIKLRRFEEEEYREKEFLLTGLEKYQMKKGVREFALPLGAFAKVAQVSVEEKKESYERGLSHFSIDQLFDSEEIELHLEGVRLIGKLENISSNGIFLDQKQSLAEIAKIWPLYLLYQICNLGEPTILFGKDLTAYQLNDDAKNHLERFLRYFKKAQKKASPLLPEWIPAFITRDPTLLKKEMEKTLNAPFVDPYLHWIVQKDGLFNAELLIEEWSDIAKEVYGLL